MLKKSLAFFGIALLIIIIQLITLSKPTVTCTLTFSTGLVLHDLPLARTITEQARGLSKRKNAGPGMLFVWDNAKRHVFWMRNTWVPLTVGFFDNNNTLFKIDDMAPNTETYHPSIKPIKIALELAHGQFQKNHLVIGTRLVHVICKNRRFDLKHYFFWQ
ncbi:MAG: DUF192 domain-containing protein [Gammaproteobacteria bacterium]|nr:DUF192 domain-containing protein [Gammaproteobacteria bacterium]